MDKSTIKHKYCKVLTHVLNIFKSYDYFISYLDCIDHIHGVGF